MDFRQAVRKCMIEKYRPMIAGRAARSEFWWFVLFLCLTCFVLCLTCFAALVAMGLLVPGIVVPLTMSRTSAFLLTLGPFVSLLALLPGTAGPNRFGADPLDQDQGGVFA